MSPRYDIPKAAPKPLRLVQELVNTTDIEHRREWLPTASALAEWLGEHELPGAGSVTAADLDRTHTLRESLRALLLANGGGALDEGAPCHLNSLAAEARVCLRFGADGSARLESGAHGVAAAHGRILVLVHEAMTAGTWPRLKACRNCSWAFYDYSKNRSATWCSMQLCGNRQKTRAYRARNRAGS